MYAAVEKGTLARDLQVLTPDGNSQHLEWASANKVLYMNAHNTLCVVLHILRNPPSHHLCTFVGFNPRLQTS